MITLDTSDEESLGLTGRQDAASHGTAPTNTDETSIYENITLGQARIMTGDVGVENWQRVAVRKTTINHNIFGDETVIITGDVGGKAAESFYENFFNF
jgi:hypothetical protein